MVAINNILGLAALSVLASSAAVPFGRLPFGDGGHSGPGGHGGQGGPGGHGGGPGGPGGHGGFPPGPHFNVSSIVISKPWGHASTFTIPGHSATTLAPTIPPPSGKPTPSFPFKGPTPSPFIPGGHH